MKNNSNILAALAGAAIAALASSAVAQQCQVIFAEDFDSIDLGMNVMEGIDTGSGGQVDDVWTPDLPAGWSDTFSCTGDGVTEWQGWNIASGAWWQFTGGDQRRSDFTVKDGHYQKGACLIADGDEWDDFNRQGCGPYNAYVTTAPISLTGVAANSVTLNFVESWRDETPQEASVEVSFDGGSTWSTVQHYSSDSGSGDFQDDIFNGTRSIAINNPGGAGSMLVRFGYYNAGNNWWWAIDDIAVTGNTSNAPSYPPAFFTISVPTFNLTPGVQITWGAACGASSYIIELAKDAEFTDVRHSATKSTVNYTIPGNVPTGIYFVRVTARNSAGDRGCLVDQRIVLDNPCFADTNGDGTANTIDFIEYLNRWVAGCP
ncbi:MAG: hypothetical protein IT431_16270 [Phycisphaerales bacterium]|nr:hypothetical protein [Phycisphaerales bacterium]